MTYKVVYNNDFGGFSLSEKAVRLGRELSGNPKWGGAVLDGEYYPDGSGPATKLFSSYHIDDTVPRHDKILVTVVEQLGDAASGGLASLEIQELVGNKYRIDEYDGSETVVEPNEEEWTVID